MKKISFIGLGKLGLPLATNFAKNGINVTAIDINLQLIDSLITEHKALWFEPDLENNIQQSIDNISYISNYDDLYKTDATIILVNTPSKSLDGSFSNEYIIDALTKISYNLKKYNKKNHLIIISSTVMPKSANEEFIPLIESITNWKLNIDFGLCYVPDFVALGQVIRDFENPDFLLIGESNEYYGNLAKDLYGNILKNGTKIIKTSLIEAEISKVSLNAYITMKISFFNFIGNVAERYKCNPLNITTTLGYDKRISPYYTKSGTAFGGTCFPRDTYAFIKMSEKVNLDAIHIKSADIINKEQNKLMYETLVKYRNKKIGIVGLSFKPNTTVDTESPGKIIYDKLKLEKYDIYYYDKLISGEFSNNLSDFIDNCDVLVLMHDDKSLFLGYEDKLKNKIIINPWNLNI